MVESETSVIASMFKTIPNVTGKTGFKLHREDVYEQIEKTGYAKIPRFSSSKLYSVNRHYALMGNVIYPIPLTVTTEVSNFMSALINSNEAIVIPFNVGDLTPAASRESLSLNEKTTKVVIDKFNAAVAKAKSNIQEELKNFDHPVPAYRYLISRVTAQFAGGFKFKGKDFSRVVSRKFKLHNFCISKSVFYSSRGYKPRVNRREEFTVYDAAPLTKVVVYQKSEAKSPSETKRNAYFKDYASGNSELHSTLFLEFSRVLSAAQRKRQLEACSAFGVDFDPKTCQVSFLGEPISEGLGNRLVEAAKSRDMETFESLAAFTKNLNQNPSYRAVNELYEFLVASDIKITKDGLVECFKRVNENYTDVYSGKFDNSPGKYVHVPRNKVDENSEVTCSYGLHVCSKAYLSSYNGARVVKVHVHPKDFVAIPKDYYSIDGQGQVKAKARVCAYKVIEDVTKEVL